ncbi:MAG: hypothetical protein MUE44_08215 [Oscillatoriaceae cyanobacterium Prado104]|jgi:hypothetical protein|nr:hypothetical protein [Oscillatoriaceae cyanobacterium Prado104]
MTAFPQDQFVKEYFKELLSPLGGVETSKDVPDEDRQIDVWFKPTSFASEYAQSLGLLGKLAATTAIIEVFHNEVDTEEIFSCTIKAINSTAKIRQEADRENQDLAAKQLPRLWVLTPTVSEHLLNGFDFRVPPKSEGWEKGVYFLPEAWRVGLIAIHQLPIVAGTLWLRVLGKGQVQQQAIAELTALPVDRPLRVSALQLLGDLQASLQANPTTNPATDLEDAAISKI